MLRVIIFALVWGISNAATAQDGPARSLELADNVPERHIVVSGDTLWDLASKFLKDPFLWPELWRMNAQEVRNPHRIYPGQVLILDRSGDQPRLKLGNVLGDRQDKDSSEGGGSLKNGLSDETLNQDALTKLRPQVRVQSLPQEISSIPANVIEPFLSQPLVIQAKGFASAPRIVATQENRLFTGTGDVVYATRNLDPKIKRWDVFRPGKTLRDPDTREVLGIEAIYLGLARPAGDPGDVQPMEITVVKQEIGKGDYLVPASRPMVLSYAPHAPRQEIGGRVIGIYGGIGEAASHSVVSLSRGSRDGLEPGHVLSVYRAGPQVKSSLDEKKPTTYTLPDERVGLLFVFRVFDRVSYAFVAQARRPILEGDRLGKP